MRAASGLTAGAFLLLVLGACSLDVQQPQSTLWEGQLSPTGPESTLSGNAAAIVREETTEAGLEVNGGEAGDRWIWRLREGTCDSPGPALASADQYPVLEAEEQTDAVAPGPVVKASGETVLGLTLDSDGAYHVVVAAEEAPDTLLACGDLSVS